MVQDAGVLAVLPSRKNQLTCWSRLSRTFQDRTAVVALHHLFLCEGAVKKTEQFRHLSNRHCSQAVTNSDSSALHIRHFTKQPHVCTQPYFSTTKLPTTNASMPEIKNVRTASVGVETIGSPRRLNDVFITTGTPVRLPNSRIKRQ